MLHWLDMWVSTVLRQFTQRHFANRQFTNDDWPMPHKSDSWLIVSLANWRSIGTYYVRCYGVTLVSILVDLSGRPFSSSNLTHQIERWRRRWSWHQSRSTMRWRGRNGERVRRLSSSSLLLIVVVTRFKKKKKEKEAIEKENMKWNEMNKKRTS